MNVVLLSVLAFEQLRWNRPGAKDQAIHDTFRVSAYRYHQALNALIDDPAALAFDPVLVNRLRRLREQRRSKRSA